MKKIIIIGVFFFCLTMNCHAGNLNYRTNMLMDYEYQVENISYTFQAYENNETDHFIFTTTPIQMPSYKTNYWKFKIEETNLDSNKFDILKKYMWITQIEDDFLTKINYYMGTQLLIWQYFHPEIDVQMDGKEERIRALEQINMTPSWVHDYEIEEELRIEKVDEFTLSSYNCEIMEEETSWVITNCSENAFIKVNEAIEDELTIYHNGEQIELFEIGASPMSWIMNITIKEKIEELPNDQEDEEEEKAEEIKTPETEVEEEKTEPIEIPVENDTEVPKNITSLDKEEEMPLEKETSDKIRIENVPNTEENKSIIPFLLLVIILLYVLKWKKSKQAYL